VGSLYFDRRASVTIGSPAVGPFLGNPIAGLGFRIDSATVDTLGKYAEGFRITFEVVKTNTREPNTAKIQVYNLSQPTANQIDTRDDVVILQAGYGNVVEQLYVGDITKAGTVRVGVDRITSIECGTAAKATRTGKLAESFSPGTPDKAIFAKAAEALGLPLGDIDGLSDDQEVNGFSSTGRISDLLDKVVGKTGASWSVQDGALTVCPKKPVQSTGLLLTPDSGLIQSPEKTDIGVKFRALLSPSVAPCRIVQIQSENVTGFFRVLKVTHRGDTRGGGSSFVTEAEAESISI